MDKIQLGNYWPSRDEMFGTSTVHSEYGLLMWSRHFSGFLWYLEITSWQFGQTTIRLRAPFVRFKTTINESLIVQ